MKQINVEDLRDNELSTDNVENIQGEQQNSSDSIGLSNYDEKNSCQENEILDINEIETRIMMDRPHVDEIDLLSDTTDDDMQPVNEVRMSKRKSAKSSAKENRRYLPAWEKLPEAFYRTYTYDVLNVRHEKLICWLYRKKEKNGKDTLRCKLCEKFKKIENSNNKPNLWCTSGYEDMRVVRIKEHKDNEVHQDAQRLELQMESHCQPSWSTTQTKERSKYEAAIQNLILPAVYICKQDQSINSFGNLCTLLEAVGVKLLPAELGGITYRNDNAALEFLHYVATYLHEEIVEKIKQSPCIGKKNFTI
jgi:hypothetical protein